MDNYYYSKINSKRSLDTNDFDISFAKGLSLENGATTITDLTSELLSKKIGNNDIFVSGGGRKNKSLIFQLKNKIKNKLFLIDDLNIDGVGVFVNENINNLINFIKDLKLEIIQLHGEEDNNYIKLLNLNQVKLLLILTMI